MTTFGGIRQHYCPTPSHVIAVQLLRTPIKCTVARTRITNLQKFILIRVAIKQRYVAIEFGCSKISLELIRNKRG